MKTLSACLIVRDEETVIERCLKSLNEVCDEIIVVDTGSTDNTIEVCKKFDKVKLFNFTWIEDFSAARNYSFSKAVGDYKMWFDADEYLTEELSKFLLDLKQYDFYNYDVLYTHIKFLDENLEVKHTCYRDRIVKSSLDPHWIYPIHELYQYGPDGPSSENLEKCWIDPLTQGYVNHLKQKESNSLYYLDIFRNQFNHGKKLDPTHHNYFYYAWSLCIFERNPSIVEFMQALSYRDHFDWLRQDSWILESKMIQFTQEEEYQVMMASLIDFSIEGDQISALLNLINLRAETPERVKYLVEFLLSNVNRFKNISEKNLIDLHLLATQIFWNAGDYLRFERVANIADKRFNSKLGAITYNYNLCKSLRSHKLRCIIINRSNLRNLANLINQFWKLTDDVIIINTTIDLSYLSNISNDLIMPVKKIYVEDNEKIIKNELDKLVDSESTNIVFYNKEYITESILNTIYKKSFLTKEISKGSTITLNTFD